MMRYYGKNYRPFNALTDCKFGREIIYTRQKEINKDNIVKELDKALNIHRKNAEAIRYLDGYYRGDQPILYRKKATRPEINNKVVINLAYELVERKVADICAEPMQYVLVGNDEFKAEQMTQLNAIMVAENKQEVDIELCRWRSICGTAYRWVGNDSGRGSILDETEFELRTEDPEYTFVAYYTNNKPAFSCQIYLDESNNEYYEVYTNKRFYRIKDKKIVDETYNGNRAIPVVEYPNNSRRLSDIEITISITDAINTLSSDRINGIEQFVSSWVKFVNCEIDKKLYSEMRQEGALVVKSNNGSDNKADVDVMTSELNQTEGQVVFEDLFNRFLDIQGLANREGNTGGDTGNAVSLRNGHYDSSLRTMINEPILRKSEYMFLRIVLNRLRIKKGFLLVPSEVEIHINHNKLDNLLTKAEALKMLLECGVEYKRAIKTVDLFSDPERVAAESSERMEYLYPTEDKVVEPVVVQKDGGANGNTEE